jgi:hypothetical protein
LHLLSEADRAVIDAFTAPIIASLQPNTPQEAELARIIAEETWRLAHAREVERGWFAESIADAMSQGAIDTEHAIAIGQARSFGGEGARHLRLTLYEQRISRAIEKARERLASEAKANSRFGSSTTGRADAPGPLSGRDENSSHQPL